jgi:secreted trypsin-like serine protease
MMSVVLLIIVLSFTSIHFISATSYTCDPSVSCGCSEVSTVVTARIVGGEAAANNTWGWMLSLRKSGSHICGASLLTSEYAVTAAHCVEDGMNNPSILSILAGTNYLNDLSGATVQRRTITKIIPHPNYVPVLYINDIAILRFSPLTISSSSNLAFICLPYANQDPFQTNNNLVAIGWGYTYENSLLVSNYLQQVTVQVFAPTSSACKQSGLTNSNIQFCAGVNGGGKGKSLCIFNFLRIFISFTIDTCQGDSGGPLMAFVDDRWVLAGITSSGYGCAQPGYPGIYTRVSAFISFIDSKINSLVTETTKISVPTSTTNNQPITIINHGNVIDKSVLTLVFCFSFWFFH